MDSLFDDLWLRLIPDLDLWEVGMLIALHILINSFEVK